MHNTDQGIAVWEEISYRCVDSAGNFSIKRDKHGKLITSRDVVLRGGPKELNGRILGVVGNQLSFPSINLTFKDTGKYDGKGRRVFNKEA